MGAKRIAPISDEAFKEAVALAKNKTQLERLLYGNPRQGRPNALVERAEKLNLDMSHWTGARVPKPSLRGPKKPLEDLKGGSVRRRILQEKLLEEQCAACHIGPEWQGKRLTLHLDHINGNSSDNRLENLRFLCPNCHQQTKTWGNTYKKLPTNDSLLRDMAKTMSNSEIADHFEVDPSSVSHRLRKYNDKP